MMLTTLLNSPIRLLKERNELREVPITISEYDCVLTAKLPSLGLELATDIDSDKISAIFVKAPKGQESFALCLSIPFDISASTSRAEAIRLLGEPTIVGKRVADQLKSNDPLIDNIKDADIVEAIMVVAVQDGDPKWDRWDFEDYFLHLQYGNPGERVSVVTIMTPYELECPQ